MVNTRNIKAENFKTANLKYHTLESNFFKSKKDALNFAKSKNIKSIKGETQGQFIDKIKYNKLNDIRNNLITELRQNRSISKNGIFTQSTGDGQQPNEMSIYLSMNIDYEINEALSTLSALDGVYVKLKLMNIVEVIDPKTKKLKYSNSYSTTGVIQNNIIQNKLIYQNYLRAPSANSIYCIGYQIFIPYDGNENIDIADYYRKFKAFSPCENVKFHKLTSCSTTTDKICIYQSYFYLYVNSSKKIKQNEKIINESLKNESKEIQKMVKNGELINFLQAKISKQHKYFIVEFFKKSPIVGVKITKDKVEEIKHISQLKGEKTFLYDNQHVAPRINDEEIKIIKERKSYALRPSIIKDSENDEDDNIIVLGYDIETYTDDKTNAISYCICLSNGETFYGVDCVINFCAYLDKIKTLKNMTKTRARKQEQKIYMYGFNNSRFDNILIFNTLFDNNKDGSKLDYVICGSSVKFINVIASTIGPMFKLANKN